MPNNDNTDELIKLIKQHNRQAMEEYDNWLEEQIYKPHTLKNTEVWWRNVPDERKNDVANEQIREAAKRYDYKLYRLANVPDAFNTRVQPPDVQDVDFDEETNNDKGPTGER